MASTGKQEATMGIWGFMNFGKETVKKLCKICYGYSVVAVRKMDDVVRVKGLQKLSEYMPDDEGRAKIVYFSSKFIKNASIYAFKEAANILIPDGRAVIKIYSETVREIEIESRENQGRSCIKEIIGNSSTKTTGNVALNEAEMLESRELNSFAHPTQSS